MTYTLAGRNIRIGAPVIAPMNAANPLIAGVAVPSGISRISSALRRPDIAPTATKPAPITHPITGMDDTDDLAALAARVAMLRGSASFLMIVSHALSMKPLAPEGIYLSIPLLIFPRTSTTLVMIPLPLSAWLSTVERADVASIVAVLLALTAAFSATPAPALAASLVAASATSAAPSARVPAPALAPPRPTLPSTASLSPATLAEMPVFSPAQPMALPRPSNAADSAKSAAVGILPSANAEPTAVPAIRPLAPPMKRSPILDPAIIPTMLLTKLVWS